MNDLWVIAWGNGLRDGLNPCMFMTCAVFICLFLYIIPANVVLTNTHKCSAGIHSLWLCIIFGLTYAAGTLLFNFGPAQVFLFHKDFIFASKVIYFILGAGSFILGVLSLKDWVLLRRGHVLPQAAGGKMGPLAAASGLVKCLVMVILALLLSAMATLWPINNYLMLLGNLTFLKGQWQLSMPLLTTYIFTAMWPLWLVWVFLSIRGLRPSLVKIVCASIFVTASSSMIFIFK